ncbi:MAG: flavin reductase family protein [Desulfobulbaceae bacterium]|nr:flavin reductase family protein [Desulfobulbaceae bacterium]
MNFKKIDLNQANRLINHGPTILVTAKHEKTINLMTAAWCMPVSKKPPMLAVAIGTSRFTHELIIKSGEFCVCVPGHDLAEQVMCAGTTSGRSGDNKFEKCGLTAITGEHVQAPLVSECLGALECKLDSHPTAGDHSIIVGEVLAVWVKPDAFGARFQVESAPTLHHLGGREFCLPGKVIKA